MYKQVCKIETETKGMNSEDILRVLKETNETDWFEDYTVEEIKTEIKAGFLEVNKNDITFYMEEMGGK